MPEKDIKYTIVHQDDETVLVDDPRSWDEHQIGFQRSDDFGINIQNIASLSFIGAGRALLRDLYMSTGIFTVGKLKLEKRQNDWTYAPYYIYRLDFSSYKDDLSTVEMSGVEDGLAHKVELAKDTEFDIPLPEKEIDKVYMEYTGVSVVKSNQLQCLYGDTVYKSGLAGAHVLRANRAVRTYSDSLSFLTTEGEPFDTMTFRCVQDGTFHISLSLILTIQTKWTSGGLDPGRGRIEIIKHDASFSFMGSGYDPHLTYPTQSVTSTNSRNDIFNTLLSVDVDLVAGQHLSVVYHNSYSPRVTEASKCYIAIANLVASAYNQAALEVFTYEYLLRRILEKIDSESTLQYEVSQSFFLDYITSNTCVVKLNTQGNYGTIKTKLSDVLESLNKLKCIGIDITGNTMTVKNRADMYPTGSLNSRGQIPSNNIKIEHSVKDMFNKISVGASTDSRQQGDDMIYPFICEKSYKVKDSLAANELNLVNPFMLDPYQIDKFINDTINKEAINGSTENKFAVFACKAGLSSSLAREYYWSVSDSGDVSEREVKSKAYSQEFLLARLSSVKFKYKTTSTYGAILDKTLTEARVEDHNGIIVWSEVTHGSFESEGVQVMLPAGTYSIIITCTTSGDFPVSAICVNNSYLSGYADPDSIQWVNAPALYRDHTISNFGGDADTVYNIPYTPKRILRTHSRYLALSVYGKTDKTISFESSTINNPIISQCAFEGSEVVEDSDLVLSFVEPMFLPATISFDTTENAVDVENFNAEKYKFLSCKDEKTGKTYEGWINSATFAVAQNKSKSILLQAKTL